MNNKGLRSGMVRHFMEPKFSQISYIRLRSQVCQPSSGVQALESWHVAGELVAGGGREPRGRKTDKEELQRDLEHQLIVV